MTLNEEITYPCSDPFVSNMIRMYLEDNSAKDGESLGVFFFHCRCGHIVKNALLVCFTISFPHIWDGFRLEYIDILWLATFDKSWLRYAEFGGIQNGPNMGSNRCSIHLWSQWTWVLRDHARCQKAFRSQIWKHIFEASGTCFPLQNQVERCRKK